MRHPASELRLNVRGEVSEAPHTLSFPPTGLPFPVRKANFDTRCCFFTPEQSGGHKQGSMRQPRPCPLGFRVCTRLIPAALTWAVGGWGRLLPVIPHKGFFEGAPAPEPAPARCLPVKAVNSPSLTPLSLRQARPSARSATTFGGGDPKAHPRWQAGCSAIPSGCTLSERGIAQAEDIRIRSPEAEGPAIRNVH